MVLPTFNVGDQLPMFVDVAALADAIDEGLVYTGDIIDDDSAHDMFDRKADESANFADEYDTALEDTPPSVIAVGGASYYDKPEVGDGHHRLAAWAVRGQLAPITFTDDIEEVYESLDSGPCYED